MNIYCVYRYIMCYINYFIIYDKGKMVKYQIDLNLRLDFLYFVLLSEMLNFLFIYWGQLY